MKDILFIGGTHGDEAIGVETLQNIENKYANFDWIIGNEPALQQGTRCFEGDLNRSAPGDNKEGTFEERRAAEIIELSQNYTYTIDIHGTNKDTGIFIILNTLTKENLCLATMLDIKNIVYWPAISKELQGPLTAYTPIGLEIECGKKDSKKIKKQLKKILINFIEHYKMREKENWNVKLKTKNIYEVCGTVKTKDGNDKFGLQEFKKTTVNDEIFIPLLIGSYEDVLCYKMKRLAMDQVLSRI